MKPMMEAEWFKREFNFDQPVELFPALIERVRGTPARVEELVRSFPPEILTRRLGERWSIQELVGHLYDLDELHEGRLQDYRAGAEVLRAADLTNKKTHEADHNAKPVEDVLAIFREARMSFVAELEAVDEQDIGISAMHPRLGKPMRIIDLAYFVAEHDDHHLAEMTFVGRSLIGVLEG
ncbi:MAG TPA: DinB family protein [Chloroflexia bacterium]|nr:DinB family protein [Chloroflexia bacterium]